MRQKLLKYKEIKSLPNVFQYLTPNKAGWKNHFNNNNPIVLELACGKGEYTVKMAKLFPQKNFIGIDQKGARIWNGAKIAIAENLNNVAFLQCNIEKLDDYFTENEIKEIWITFPDPFPKKRQAKHRLTSNKFITLYKKILAKNGYLNLKTDSFPLYIFSKKQFKTHQLQIIHDLPHIYQFSTLPETLQIQTTFEKKHLKNGKEINFIRVRN